MSSDKTVSYEVDANADGFVGGLQRGATALRSFSTDAEGQFKKVQDAISSVQKQLVVLAGIVAGGAFFKDAMQASMQLTGETVRLSKALGISGEEAGTLNTALKDIGTSGDEYVSAFDKFARQLKSNEKGLQDLGLQTRDTNGNLRDSKELFTEALQSVGQYKAGLDQTTYAQTVFGKSVDEVRTLQKLNNQVLDEAAAKNRELGLIVTQENVEASKKYKLAMNDVGDVLTAVKKVVGDAVMPVFTQLAQYFASTGPYVVAVFKGAMVGLLTAFELVKAAVKTVAGIVFESFNLIVEGAGLLGEVFSKLLSGDFSGAYEAAKQVGKRTAQAFTNAFANFVDAGNQAGAAVKNHVDALFGDKTAAPAPKSGSRRMGDFKEKKDGSEIPGWEAELAAKKLAYEQEMQAEGSVRQFSKQQEADFWKSKIELTEKGSQARSAVQKREFDLERGMLKDKVDAQRAAFDTEAAAFKNNTDAKMEVLTREAAFVKDRYGEESKEYQAVQKTIVETKRQAAEQIKQIEMLQADASRAAQLAEVDAAAKNAQFDLEMGTINNAQLLALQEQLETRRAEIERQGLAARLQIALLDSDRNPVEIARINEQLEEAERQHQDRLALLRKQAALNATAISRAGEQQLLSGWQSSLSQMMQGSLTLSSFLKNIWTSIRSTFADALAKMLIEWVKNSVAMAAVKRALALFDIGANAAQGAAGAASSAADTPVIGWLLAAGAAAATFATISSLGNSVPTFSAAGGYDIPATINPLVQAHANEMILPAKYADVIRGLAANGGVQTSAPEQPMHIHIHAVDARGVERLFQDNGDALVRVLKAQRRQFAF